MRLLIFVIITVSAFVFHAGSSSDEDRCCTTCREEVRYLGQRVEELERQNEAWKAMVMGWQAQMTYWESAVDVPSLGLHTTSFREGGYADKRQRKLQAAAVTQLLTSDPDLIVTADDVVSAMDTLWLLLCSALVMFMQAGFALVECGSCRAKNMQYVLVKNISDMMIGLVGWWLCGWSIAFGSARENFVSMGLNPVDENGTFTGGIESGKPGPVIMTSWFFQWAFCSVATTIVSGAVAERVDLKWYMLYSFLMTSVIYPVVVNWTWGGGWLSTLSPAGYVDFAGSGVVHLTGGTAALAGAWIAGPREGRWRWDWPADFKPHNVQNIVVGTLILWFGWYGFNCGSTASMHSAANAALASVVAINTTLAAASSGCVSFVLRAMLYRKADLTATCNGILAGLVSITAPCANVEFGSAMAVGVIGGLLYSGASWLLLHKLQVDDPVDAFSVHGVCGAWGVIAAALFDWGEGVNHVHGSSFTCIKDADSNECSTGLWIQLLGTNVLAVLVIVTWSGFWTIAIFGTLSFFGLLTSPLEVQDKGLDQQSCYPEKGLNVPREHAEKKKENKVQQDRENEKERVDNIEAIKQLFGVSALQPVESKLQEPSLVSATGEGDKLETSDMREKPETTTKPPSLPGEVSSVADLQSIESQHPEPPSAIKTYEADQRTEVIVLSQDFRDQEPSSASMPCEANKTRETTAEQDEMNLQVELMALGQDSRPQEPSSASKTCETNTAREITAE